MEQTSKTETEQLYEKMTDKAEEQTQEPEETKQADEQEQDEEEILSEEELEIAREIEAYQSKIEALDAKLAAHKAQHIDAMKREKMKEAHYTDEQIERYLPHIEGETADEIMSSVFDLIDDIPAAGDDPYGNPSLMNGRANRPKPVDHESVGREIGKKAFERVKNKIHGLRWW